VGASLVSARRRRGGLGSRPRGSAWTRSCPRRPTALWRTRHSALTHRAWTRSCPCRPTESRRAQRSASAAPGPARVYAARRRHGGPGARPRRVGPGFARALAARRRRDGPRARPRRTRPGSARAHAADGIAADPALGLDVQRLKENPDCPIRNLRSLWNARTARDTETVTTA